MKPEKIALNVKEEKTMDVKMNLIMWKMIHCKLLVFFSKTKFKIQEPLDITDIRKDTDYKHIDITTYSK